MDESDPEPPAGTGEAVTAGGYPPSPPAQPTRPPTEEMLKGRVEMADHLRTLIRFVCEQRLGSVPPDLAERLPGEDRLLLLSRWYVGAGTLSADELTELVHRPLPE